MVVIFTRFPGQIERVDRNAVSAKARTRIECHESVRLRFRGVNHFPDVDAHLVAKNRHLVRQRDIDVAECIFIDFLQLSYRRAGYFVYFPFEHGAVHGCGHFRAIRRYAADYFRGILCVEVFITRVNALRRVCEEEVLSADKAGFFENRLQQFFRRTRICRTFKYNQHTRMQILSDFACG